MGLMAAIVIFLSCGIKSMPLHLLRLAYKKIPNNVLGTVFIPLSWSHNCFSF
jgi:hypothetical protein